MRLRVPAYVIAALLLFAFLPLLGFGQGDIATRRPQTNSETPRTLSPWDAKVERAKIQMAEKQYEIAIRSYQDLLQAQPKNAVFLNMIGIAYLDLSEYDQAKRYFQRSEKADKKYSSAVNNLGMVWYFQKRFPRAIREYKKAVAIEPLQAGTHANLGFAYYNTDKYPEAVAEFQKALELDPLIFEHNERVGTMLQDRSVTNHGLFFYTMARVYATKGDAEHCAAYLRKSFDEGYKDLVKAKTDPAFKLVLDDPGVQAVFALMTPPEPKVDPPSPGV